MGSRVRLAALVAIAALLAAAGVATAAGRSRNHRVFRGHRPALSTAEIRRLSKGAARPSIIILKNQLTRTPARAATAQARIAAANRAQAPIRAELARVHAKNVRGFHLINAIAASVTSAEAKRLRGDWRPGGRVPDSFNSYASLGSGPGPSATPDLASSGPQPICPSNPAQPIIEPEAREVMNVDAAEQLADGSGIRVGIVADGIDPNNPDLIRPNGQHVIFDYEDFSGFGTNAPTDGRESFLDAGTIASQANQTYDLSGFVNPAHPLPPGCNIKIKGIAPGASLAVMNLSGPNAGFFNSTIIQGIEWAVLHDHVNILNESIGGNPIPNTEDDPVSLADKAAVAAGVVVVASSGDAGPFNNIGSPATTPGVIAVGGTTTYRVYRQTTRYGTQLSPGGWEDNNITALSSDGITEFNPDTVDVVAPGDRGWSLCSSDTTKFFGCADLDHGTNPPPIWAAGGTSASAPETSGTAALVLQAYAKTHNGRLPSPATVQRIIDSTATDLGAPADRQGSGLVNTLKAVQLAMSIDGGHNTGNALEVDQTSLNATVDAGSTHTFTEHVTNEGAAAQTVTPTVVGRPTTPRQRRRRGRPVPRLADLHRRRGQHGPLRRAPVRGPAGRRLPDRRHHLERPVRGHGGVRDAVRPAGPGGGLLAARHRPQRVRPRRGPQAERRYVDRGDLHRRHRRRRSQPRRLHRRGPVPVRLAAVPRRGRRVAGLAHAGARSDGRVQHHRQRRPGRRRGPAAAPRHGRTERRQRADHHPLAGAAQLGRRDVRRHADRRGLDRSSPARRSPTSSGSRRTRRR